MDTKYQALVVVDSKFFEKCSLKDIYEGVYEELLSFTNCLSVEYPNPIKPIVYIKKDEVKDLKTYINKVIEYMENADEVLYIFGCDLPITCFDITFPIGYARETGKKIHPVSSTKILHHKEVTCNGTYVC